MVEDDDFICHRDGFVAIFVYKRYAVCVDTFDFQLNHRFKLLLMQTVKMRVIECPPLIYDKGALMTHMFTSQVT